MSTVTLYENFPATPEEVQANRVRFIEALINEDPDAQCEGNLFEACEYAPDGQEKRCALGVAAKLFLGVSTYQEAHQYDVIGADYLSRSVYDDLTAILGIPNARPIWQLNDTDELSFAEIGQVLRHNWELPSE